jgi:hypothetical protein
MQGDAVGGHGPGEVGETHDPIDHGAGAGEGQEGQLRLAHLLQIGAEGSLKVREFRGLQGGGVVQADLPRLAYVGQGEAGVGAADVADETHALENLGGAQNSTDAPASAGPTA